MPDKSNFTLAVAVGLLVGRVLTDHRTVRRTL